MERTVIYNGVTFKNTTINISKGSQPDGIGGTQTNNSTRTGYYLKKMLIESVNLRPTVTAQMHAHPFIRYTEMFLAYAEAANERWGPDGGPKDYTPRAIIAAIRGRGGIDARNLNPEDSEFDPNGPKDPYLASITTKETMRDLIQNERRLELCFESFRFWDLRRWKSQKMFEAVRGCEIDNGVYNYFEVEKRLYEPHMFYGPIPNGEIAKYKFIQNKGW